MDLSLCLTGALNVTLFQFLNILERGKVLVQCLNKRYGGKHHMDDKVCCKTRPPNPALSVWICVMTMALIFLAVLLIFRPPASTAEFGGIQAQLTNRGDSVISDSEEIIFDSILSNHNPNISYANATGTFTITKPGNYYVSWWVTTDGSSEFTNMNFSIALNGAPYSTGTSPIVSGQVSGSEMITVVNTPVTVTLINNSSNDILIADTPVQANIVIVGIYS